MRKLTLLKCVSEELQCKHFYTLGMGAIKADGKEFLIAQLSANWGHKWYRK